MPHATSSPVDLLPDVSLAEAGSVSAAFRGLGCDTLRAAARYVWQLPYGRNAKVGHLSVLEEGRGTCSTKHALVARLLDEQGVPGIELRLGIYAMSEANTPGVGAILSRHGLESIPEAHCYLVAGGVIVDLTRVTPPGAEPIGNFLYEEAITPDQVGDYKRTLHRRFLEEHAGSGAYAAFTGDALWAIREQCIAALQQLAP